MPALRRVATGVRGGASALGGVPAFGAVADVITALAGRLDDLSTAIGRLERVPGLIDRIDALVDRIDTLVNRVDTLVNRIDGIVDRADHEVGQAVVQVQRVDRITREVERLVPVASALAAMTDPGLDEVAPQLLRQLPTALDQLANDIVPALRAMRAAVPDVEGLRALADRLEPYVTELSKTVVGLPGAGRMKRRGERELEDDPDPRPG